MLSSLLSSLPLLGKAPILEAVPSSAEDASLMMWLPQACSGLSCSAPSGISLEETSEADPASISTSTSTSPFLLPDTPPLHHSIASDPFSDRPISPPPLSISMMSMATDTDEPGSGAASAGPSPPRYSSISSSSSPDPSPIRPHTAPPLTLRDLLRSYNSAPPSSMCSSSSAADVAKPAEKPVMPGPAITFTISTFRWKEVTEFVGEHPIVEVRPYNKSDGKRYLYVRLDGIDRQADDHKATFHIRRVDTDEVLGYLSNRDAVDPKDCSVVLSSNLALLVSEVIVRRLDQDGIGRGCPPPPNHKLELVVTWRRDACEDVVIARLPFFRIKRRHKRNATIYHPLPNSPKRARPVCASGIGAGVWASSVAGASAAKIDLLCSPATTAESAASHESAAERFGEGWLDDGPAATPSPSPTAPPSCSCGHLDDVHTLCERANEACLAAAPPRLRLLSARQCYQADMFLHPAVLGANDAAAAAAAAAAASAATAADQTSSTVVH